MRFSSSPVFTGRRSVSGTFFALLVGMGLLGGCSGGSSGSGTPSVAAGSLVGRWRQTTISTDQASVTCPGSLNVPSVGVQSCSADSVITFSADQTFVSSPGTASGLQTSGTWRIDGETLILQTASPIGTTVPQSFRITLNNGILSAALVAGSGISITQYTVTYVSAPTS